MEKIITSSEMQTGKNWFDKYYKPLAFIPIIFIILSLIFLFNFHSKTGDFMYRDVSLSGGTTITINGDFNLEELEEKLSTSPILQDFNLSSNDLSFRKLSNLQTGKILALIIESSSDSELLKNYIELVGNLSLNEDNSSIEFTGNALSSSFYKQLITALAMSFILMSLVILFLFRSFIPSFGIILSGFANIVIPLAIIDFIGIKLSAAGIAAFLMIIGYSVDINILLTTRAIKNTEGELNSRIFRAFKTGMFMSTTALVALLPAFFIITGLPDSFRQIFLILSIGLIADIFNTWLTNVGLIKWYCLRKHIN
jgi:preprotein translocase subunit SecF